MDEPTEIRTEHFSHAGFYIACGLLKHLQAKGVLTRGEVIELIGRGAFGAGRASRTRRHCKRHSRRS